MSTQPKRARNPHSRHGKLPKGWGKQGLQAPDRVLGEFKSTARRFGGPGVKVLGTVGLDIVTHMPDEIRDELAGFVHRSTWPDPKALQPGQVWERFRQLMRERDESGEAPAPLPLARAT